MRKGCLTLRMARLIIFYTLLITISAINCKKGGHDSNETADNSSSNIEADGPSQTHKETIPFFLIDCYRDGKPDVDPNHDSPEIYLSKGNGPFEQVVPDKHFPGNMDISADGKYIAYNKSKSPDSTDTSGEIYVMRLSDKKEFRITNNNTKDDNPSFINDSTGKPKWILWFGERGTPAIANFYVKQIDGTGSEVNITPESDRDTNQWDPEISPDSKLIAYNYEMKPYGGCATTIRVGELIKTDNGVTGIKNIRTVSDTTAIAKADLAFNPSSTKVLYEIWDRDVSKTGECWLSDGFKDGVQHLWKIEMVGINGEGRKIVYSHGQGDPVVITPVWLDEESFLVYAGFISNPASTGVFSRTLKISISNGMSEHYRENETVNCTYFDYVRVTQ
ncbi:MAG: hypothetical protein HY606_03110 [Planctomycetes bacterium]|nr:hypothetical protein [Planctomycetota bacterium]